MALQAGDLVLVTGVNGFIASHIADQCLRVGFKVRGTVRDINKARWMYELFNKQYGIGQFEAVVVESMEKTEAFHEATKDCDGIVHAASILTFDPDPNNVIPPVIAGATGILKAAAHSKSVRRVVYTSSSTAATLPHLNESFHFDNKTWNNEVSETAWAPPPYTAERGSAVYSASKTEAEQACWDFMKKEKPQFILNTVLPNINTGFILHPDQPASTAGWMKGVWNNEEQCVRILSSIKPQYYIDVDDCARLHVAGLLFDDVKNERLMGFAAPFNFNDVVDVMKKIDPERTLPAPMKDAARDLSVVETDREVELLQRLGQSGWTDFETSIRRNVA